ncbi:MAG: ABC transporter permease [Mesorhizobium sp.]|uniref:ABC transporter permease n=1 Tax=unclassified Mesorhizobium TaxID=325217 RepID=UPI000BB08D6B|nr:MULTISPECIES: ABC transporter permease [unclassified Mesorhizobium]RVC75202.1 ABC transporter permease [Mesorhizobium sp. M2A.F.Ca.ET.046.02.1.1]AZO34091.1 ABC transporter permease [Mesorhizobium sp. M2A.F.Ca.ET.046.03.2.1]AZO71514.1 ABC transporter permease [Mesorhizobium sp. M1D.F.Ca.ET.043.01.1.1]PBC04205.1 ATPase [Mesorhizobium sp. WSM3860]RWB39404.1 MAG: ABC transporter permease [Mesorhizobium sp.]
MTHNPIAGAVAPKRVLSDLLQPEWAILPVLVVVMIVGAALNSSFLSYDNFYGVVQQASELGILTMGLTVVLIAGKFDLSLESTFGLAPMVGVYCLLDAGGSGLNLAGSPFLALIAIFLTGAVIGAFNGILVVYLKFNAFIATLATLILLRGISLGLTRGETLSDLPPLLTYPGEATALGAPVSFLVAVGLLIILTVFMSRHRIGRMLYAVGGNPQAARVAGIPVERILMGVFVVAGVLAALAGLLQAGRIASIPSSLGQNLIFNAFAAAVLGGVSLNGGRGTIAGACGGVLLLVLIQDVLVLSQVPAYWINATTGGIILVALFISKISGADKAN